jgi:O-6-methylguanine DNA methyltransferase
MKSFTDKIYELTRKIPEGKVATYKQLAALAGNAKASRAVGMLMKNNQDAPMTPCHRVVASNGLLTGYSAGEGIKTKKTMLEQEGVSFIGDKVDLLKSGWQPSI